MSRPGLRGEWAWWWRYFTRSARELQGATITVNKTGRRPALLVPASSRQLTTSLRAPEASREQFRGLRICLVGGQPA